MQRSILPVTSLVAAALLAPAADTAALSLSPSTAVAPAVAWMPRHAQVAASVDAAPEWFGRWLNGPVSLLITPPEMSAAKQVRSEREASSFTRWFWARRDPDPVSSRNEFRRRFQNRLAYVEKEFTTPEGGPGWSTLPGRLYLLLGPPPRVQVEAYGAITAGAFRDLTVWSYQLESLGNSQVRVPMVRIAGSLVLLTDRNDRRTARVLGELLRSVAENAVRNPDLAWGSLRVPRTVEAMPLHGSVSLGPSGTVLGDLRLSVRDLYGRPVGDSVRIELGLRLAPAGTAQALVLSLQLTATDYARMLNRELRVLYWGRHDFRQQPADLLITEKASGRQTRVTSMRVDLSPEIRVAVSEILMTALSEGALVVAFLEAQKGSAPAYWLTSREQLPAGREIPLGVAGLHLVAVS